MDRHIKILIDYIKAFFPYTIYRLFSFLLPVQSNKYFCMSMAGNNYGDNIKCLSDYISQKDPYAEIIWAFSKLYFNNVQCSHKKVLLYSVSYYYHIATSKYFLTNQQCRNITFRKRKGQIKLQTWHGTALKKLGNDIKQKKNNVFLSWVTPNKNKYELRDTDIFISGTQFMVDVFRSAYRWTNIYLTGTPRNDLFWHNNDGLITKIKKYFRIDGQKILLYAPTFRSDMKLNYYDVNLRELKKYFEKKDECEYVVMVRLHPNIMAKASHLSDVLKVDYIDSTLYPDMQELLYAADVLVTDYSSVMFDFMYSYKPIIIYAPDKDKYERGFYLDINSLPFVVVYSNDEITEVVDSFDWDKYQQKIDVFLKNIGSVEDGNATERVCKLLETYPNINRCL